MKRLQGFRSKEFRPVNRKLLFNINTLRVVVSVERAAVDEENLSI